MMNEPIDRTVPVVNPILLSDVVRRTRRVVRGEECWENQGGKHGHYHRHVRTNLGLYDDHDVYKMEVVGQAKGSNASRIKREMVMYVGHELIDQDRSDGSAPHLWLVGRRNRI